jgi:hypothetical protein
MDSDSVSAALAAPRPRPTAKIAACMLHRCKRHRGNLQILPPCRSVMLQTGGRSTGAHTNPDPLDGGIARALLESHCRLVLISAAGALRRMGRRQSANKERLRARGTTLAHQPLPAHAAQRHAARVSTPQRLHRQMLGGECLVACSACALRQTGRQNAGRRRAEVRVWGPCLPAKLDTMLLTSPGGRLPCPLVATPVFGNAGSGPPGACRLMNLARIANILLLPFLDLQMYLGSPFGERVTSGVPKVFLRIARKSIFFEQKT